MNKEHLEDICFQAIQVVKLAGAYIKSQIHHQHEMEYFEKGLHDFVTYVDKAAEQILINGLAEILPQAGFLAEEQADAAMMKDMNWIIDPLDGTTNFIHSIPLFSVSVALANKNEVLLGIVYEINRDECFYAWKNSRAYLNNKEIRVSETTDFNRALFATGFPYYDYSRIGPYMNLFSHLVQHTSGVRRLGSAAVDLVYVACGRFEGFFEYGLHPWDVAAGAFIVQQAGGKVSDFSGNDNFVFGKEIVASNYKIFSNFMQIIKNFFN